MGHDGVNVRAGPTQQAEVIGSLRPGAQVAVADVQFGEQSWLRVEYEGQTGWIAGEATDFARSAVYNQVAALWYDAPPVLAIRRALAQDLLRLRKAPPAQIARVTTLSATDLLKLEDTLTRRAVLPGYVRFRELNEHLGLPEPFEVLPVHTSPPAEVAQMAFEGFGPTMTAFELGDIFFSETRGMSPGINFAVDAGSPLIAVADGVITAFNFLDHPAERTIALRPYLPDRFRAADGSRVLSNVVVAYGHLNGNAASILVRPGMEVRAGEIIGTTGYPVYTRPDGSVGVQGNNAHLHLQIHLLTDGTHTLGRQMPFNPLLFWSPRLVALITRLATHTGQAPYPTANQPYGRLAFFSIGAFRRDLPGSVWEHTPTREQVWPQGVYDLDALIALVSDFAPYPLDGTRAV